METLAILLLTGGYSTRMGQNKANLKIGNRTFVEKIAAELSSCGPVCLSVSADVKPELIAADYPSIVDEVPHIGPLGGICTAMRQIPADQFFVCACDMPFMRAAYLQHLIRIREQLPPGSWDALLVRDQNGRIYTTAGIYHRRLLPQIEKQIREGNYRLRDRLSADSVFFINEENLGELRNCLININTMDEYQNASEILSQLA
ncbi:MAG: molybdenum cofactor guanylyltransferase [Clostridiales bacterium]|nr:molybdenum cofactor guanylyltransferase [Clostridiales bacterium]